MAADVGVAEVRRIWRSCRAFRTGESGHDCGADGCECDADAVVGVCATATQLEPCSHEQAAYACLMAQWAARKAKLNGPAVPAAAKKQ
jgi:hypothetical protein